MKVTSEAVRKSAPSSFQDIGREQKRRFILKAAAAAFEAKGFHAATVNDITERAGIARGTFYLYFKDKKDVYLALSRHFHERILAVILPGKAGDMLVEGADLPALVRTRLAGLARLFENEQGVARVFVYRTPGTDPEFEKHRRKQIRYLTDTLAEVLRAGTERGVFRRHDPRVAAMCLVGSIEMVIESWLQGASERRGQSLLEMMDEAAGFFLPTLLTPTARRKAAASASRKASARRRKT